MQLSTSANNQDTLLIRCLLPTLVCYSNDVVRTVSMCLLLLHCLDTNLVPVMIYGEAEKITFITLDLQIPSLLIKNTAFL